MKVTKKEIIAAFEKYNLEEAKSIKIIPGGMVNYNYEIKSVKGVFVLRVMGKKVSKTQLNFEFKLLESLHKKKFPYKIPLPIKNKKGNYLTKISNHKCWIYEKIEGNQIKEYDNKNLKEIIKALATYHKYVKKLKIKNNQKIESLESLSRKYSIMRKIVPKNKKDKIMLENIGLFLEFFEILKDIKFNSNVLPVHFDFHKDNLLFNKNQLGGILDFERSFNAPRILDIAHIIKCSYFSGEKKFMKRANFIINEYCNINPLTKKERQLILPILAKDNLWMFEKFYHSRDDCKAGEKGCIDCLNWIIDVQKNVLRELKKLND